jgi:hypothetical protein
MGSRGADTGFFVNIQPQTVAGPMSKCLSKPARFQQASSGGINGGRWDTRLDRLDGPALGIADG